MKPTSFRRHAIPASLSLLLLIPTLASFGEKPAAGSPEGLAPMPDRQDAPELALLMGDLQRLTHKMALSADAGNAGLAAFYLHESLEQLATIQRKAPEYVGQPVAALIDRMALPAYETLRKSTAADADRETLNAAVLGVIQSCNACHAATTHGIIRITPGTETNPFNQSFAR